MQVSDNLSNVKIEEEKWRNLLLDFVWCTETKKPKNYTDLVSTGAF